MNDLRERDAANVQKAEDRKLSGALSTEISMAINYILVDINKPNLTAKALESLEVRINECNEKLQKLEALSSNLSVLPSLKQNLKKLKDLLGSKKNL